MKLSIIIVNYNTKKYLHRTLSAIYKSAPAFEFEVAVVDNASRDGSQEMVRHDFPQVKLIRNSSNVGFARANNQAVPRTNGEFILFLNPDALPKAGALESIVHFMEGKPYAGCVGGKLLNSDNSLQLSCRSFPTYISVFFGRKSVFRRMFPGNPFSKGFLLTELDYNKVQKVDWIIGACMLTKRETISQLGCFDEDFFLFVEDLDFCYKAKRRGFDIYFFPDAVFKHEHGASTRRYWLRSAIHHNLGMYKFFSKNYDLRTPLREVAILLLLFRVFYVSLAKSITAGKSP
jgi:GT2 family glycosyltransferase